MSGLETGQTKTPDDSPVLRPNMEEEFQSGGECHGEQSRAIKVFRTNEQPLFSLE